MYTKQTKIICTIADNLCEDELPIQAIITSTRTGGTALICSSYRGSTPIFALSENPHIVRILSMSYGVYSAQIDLPRTTEQLVKVCLKKLLGEGKINTEEPIVFLGGGHIYSRHTNFMQVETPDVLLDKE